MLRFITEPEADVEELEHAAPGLAHEQLEQLLLLRGLLACNMLQHCLQQRHNVDFGINRCASACCGTSAGSDASCDVCCAGISLNQTAAARSAAAGAPLPASAWLCHSVPPTRLQSAASLRSLTWRCC